MAEYEELSTPVQLGPQGETTATLRVIQSPQATPYTPIIKNIVVDFAYAACA
jgi:hypothetical protein